MSDSTKLEPLPLSPEEERDLREHAAKYPGQFGYELRYFATLDAARRDCERMREALEECVARIERMHIVPEARYEDSAINSTLAQARAALSTSSEEKADG